MVLHHTRARFMSSYIYVEEKFENTKDFINMFKLKKDLIRNWKS